MANKKHHRTQYFALDGDEATVGNETEIIDCMLERLGYSQDF